MLNQYLTNIIKVVIGMITKLMIANNRNGSFRGTHPWKIWTAFLTALQ